MWLLSSIMYLAHQNGSNNEHGKQMAADVGWVRLKQTSAANIAQHWLAKCVTYSTKPDDTWMGSSTVCMWDTSRDGLCQEKRSM